MLGIGVFFSNSHFLQSQTCAQTSALALPKEHEMDPKDKYTVFSPHHRGYRKGAHKVPKWTRVCSLSLA